MIGTQSDYAMALYRDEWEHALQRGDLSMLKDGYDNPLAFCSANNIKYLNVAANLEAFWGYLWPTLSHNHEPLVGEWTATKHCGLKEFTDHAISIIGRVQIKPATECLRGVATYPQGGLEQGRYGMTLTDLMNHHYANVVREGVIELTLGQADKEGKIGDTCKDAMLEWEWLGIDMQEWPLQRLDWDTHRLEHLSFVSNMNLRLYSWHIAYSALRCMACQSWPASSACLSDLIATLEGFVTHGHTWMGAYLT